MKSHSDLTVKVVKKIGDISPGEWNAAFPDILEGYHFFKTIDESDFEGYSFYYIMVYKKGSPVGAAPCFVMDYPLDTTIEGPLKKFLAKVKEFFPNILRLRALICGSVVSEGRIGIAAGHKGPVIRKIASAMETLARKERASLVAFKDFSGQYTGALDILIKEGFYKINSYPAVEMDINFKSFDEYLDTLSSATRKDLRRKFKKANGHAKIDLEVRDEIGGALDDAYFLYLQTLYKSEVRFERVPKDFFVNISKNMKNRVKYFLWRIDGRLAAFNLCLASGGILIDEYLGLDYLLTHKYPLYFITFRDVIGWCVENGVKRYESGALTYEPKKRLDLRFIPHYIYAKHRNKFVNPFFKLLCAFLKPENFDAALKEMKKKGLL